MKKLTLAGLMAALSFGMTACGAGDVASDESLPNPGEEGGYVTAMASVSKTLWYEGACSWLKCANGNSAAGACGYGCNDSKLAFARDSAQRLSCGQSVKVTANGRTVTATVWDHSCCNRFEGTDGLLKALAIPHGDGACRGKGNYDFGFGEASATFVY